MSAKIYKWRDQIHIEVPHWLTPATRMKLASVIQNQVDTWIVNNKLHKPPVMPATEIDKPSMRKLFD